MASKNSNAKLVIFYNILIGAVLGYAAISLLWQTMPFSTEAIGPRYGLMLALLFVLAISPLLLWGLEFALYHCFVSRSIKALLIALALILSPFLLYFLPWGHNFVTPLIISGAMLLATLPMLMLRRHRDKQMYEEMSKREDNL